MASTYIVMREFLDIAEAKNVYEVIGTADTDTPRQAIKKFAENEDGTVDDGVYVACAARYWTEEEVEVRREVRYLPHRLAAQFYAIPGQTTIEEEAEVAQLAAVIEGARDDDAPKPDETPEELAERQEEHASTGVSDDNPVPEEPAPTEELDPNEFGPEVEEPFDPANLGGKEDAA